jgi:hypothetical protein
MCFFCASLIRAAGAPASAEAFEAGVAAGAGALSHPAISAESMITTTKKTTRFICGSIPKRLQLSN